MLKSTTYDNVQLIQLFLVKLLLQFCIRRYSQLWLSINPKQIRGHIHMWCILNKYMYIYILYLAFL